MHFNVQLCLNMVNICLNSKVFLEVLQFGFFSLSFIALKFHVKIYDQQRVKERKIEILKKVK